jgi:hypothetical protein
MHTVIDSGMQLAPISYAASVHLMGGLPRRLFMSSVPRLSARQLQHFEARYAFVKKFANSIFLVLIYLSTPAPESNTIRRYQSTFYRAGTYFNPSRAAPIGAAAYGVPTAFWQRPILGI